jgi:hypothetical protein
VPSLGGPIVSFHSDTVFERAKNSLSRVEGTHPNFSGNPQHRTKPENHETCLDVMLWHVEVV